MAEITGNQARDLLDQLQRHGSLGGTRPAGGPRWQRGGPGQGMGGLQISGQQGVGAGISGSWYESDWLKWKHYGKDLRAMAPQWVPQVLESTPEAQTLFSEDQYMGMVLPQIEKAVNQMMGGYRTGLDNIRRGLAARGLSSSTAALGLQGQAEASARSTAAGYRAGAVGEARLGRLGQALNYRTQALGLGLGIPTPPHQYPKPAQPGVGGQIAGAIGGGILGGLTGGIGMGLGGAVGGLFSGGDSQPYSWMKEGIW